MANITNNTFPSQKKTKAQKNTTWRKECVNGGENACIWKDEVLRQSYENKRINYNLYSDILDQNDIERICNPRGLSGLGAPAKMQNYPICNPKIDLLVGEAIKRKFDWKVRVINDDAISQKEEELRKKLIDLITGHLTQNPKTPEEQRKVEEELKNFQNYMDFEYQDSRERVATQILSYLYKHLQLDYLFSKGFKDALICAEEIYQIDIIAGEPKVLRLNPLNVHVVRSGESNFIEDADIITIIGYMSPGQIIDEYHEYLKPSDITQIESGFNSGGATKSFDIGHRPELALKVDHSIDLSVLANDGSMGSPFDNNGNIRVTKVYWKSMRKIKKVKFYDAQGDVQYDFFDEDYTIDKTKGEEETVYWVSEWWEGHKIGGTGGSLDDSDAIYVRMQPRPIQFRSMENPSKCHPGIVGTIYNTNDNSGVSLMDRMKPYQYMYNLLGYNSQLAISKNKGKIMRINVQEIPDKWKPEQWLAFVESMNVAFYDPFREGNKGASQGKLAGGMPAQAPVIDLEMGNSIQLYMNMMAYIKQELGEIAGVSQARQGQISNREAVGNVEREVTQSSHITEYWFLEHDNVKLRVLSCLLETAKHAWRDRHNKKVQFVLDDGANMLFDISGAEFNECEYGLQITDGHNSQELLSSMKQLAHAGIQNGLINFSQLLDIYSTESIAAIRRKIVRSEKEKQQMEMEKEKRAQDMKREELLHMRSENENERDFVREEWDREDARKEAELTNKLEIERMRQDNENSRFYKEASLGNESVDIHSIESLRLEAEKIDREYRLKQTALQETIRHNKKGEEQKEKEIKIKKKTAAKKPSAK